jgi:protein SCO1
MNRRTFFALGAAGTGAALAAVAPSLSAPASKRPAFHQSGAAWFTNTRLQTHEGRTVRFYDDLMRDKIVLINFVFTGCSDVCPGMTQNLAYVQQLLGPRMGRDIFMYSLSLDPDNDSPERLADYAKTFGAGPGWLFLTGEKPDMELLRERLGFKDSDPVQDANLTEHIGTVRIGNEPLHRWIMAAGLANPEAIVRSVMRVIPV